MPYTDFHYTPTGTGVISGKEVLEQTEDAINDLGGQISGDVQTAIDTANNALNTANTASADAQNAVNTANTAYTAATNAQNTANAAQTTATNAQNAATAAQNDVDALENVVTGIEGRLTTTEGNVTNLTTRMGTAENNITTLQNDVITAQGTATSAQNTATLAREQAYVTRYTNTAVSDNSTVAYSDLNNTDNIKIGDFILDVNGKLFAITAVDTANETVSVTTPLTRLAVDSSVMHLSRDESSTGFKQFANIRLNNSIKGINLDSTTTDLNNCYSDFAPYGENKGGNIQYYYCNSDSGTVNISNLPESKAFFLTSINTRLISNALYVKQILINSNRKTFIRYCQNGTWSAWNNIHDELEPSSLGMPVDRSSRLDILGSFTDTSNGGINRYTAPANGFIYLLVNDIVTMHVLSQTSNNLTNYGDTKGRNTAGQLYAFLPVRKNDVFTCQWYTSLTNVSITSAYFIPCKGNI